MPWCPELIIGREAVLRPGLNLPPPWDPVISTHRRSVIDRLVHDSGRMQGPDRQDRGRAGYEAPGVVAVMVPVVKLWVNVAIDMVRVVAPVVPVMPTSRLSWYDYPAQYQTPYEKTKCAVFHFPPPFPTRVPIGGPS